MTNPMYKLGATTHNMIYRDLSDSNRTKFTNNNIDIMKLSGIDGLTAVDIHQQNPIMKIRSLNTGVTAHSTISLGLTGGDSWNLSAGVSGLSNVDPDFGFHISKNDTELVTIRNNGNIGFGTTDPQYGLDIFSNTRTQGDYFVTGNIFVAGITGGNGGLSNLWIGEGVNTYSVLSGGVGIGITNPTNKLDVIGSIGVSGNIVPLLHDTFDLGTTAIRFRDIFLSSNTIHLDGVQMSSNNTQLLLNGSLNVPTDLSVSGDMTVGGTLQGNISFGDNLSVTGTLGVTGTGTFENNLNVLGDSIMTGILGVTGTGTFENNLNVLGDSIMTGTLDVTGTGTFENDLYLLGNVGIGTTEPDHKLDIYGTAVGSEFEALFLRNTSATADSSVSLSFTVSGSTTPTAKITNEYVTAGNRGLVFSTFSGGLGERMRIEGSGNVGIGTTEPTSILTINQTSASLNEMIRLENLQEADATGSTIGFYHATGTQVGRITSEREASGDYSMKFSSYDATLVETMVLRNSSVGIGIDNPNTLLEIGDTNPQLRITDTRTDSGGAAGTEIGSIGFYNDDISGVGPTLHARISTESDSGSVKPVGRINLQTYSNGVERTVLTCSGVSGFVGILTETPSISLAVGNANTGFNWDSSNNLGFYTTGTENFRLDSSGNFTRQSGGYITGQQIMCRIGLEGTEAGNLSVTGTHTVYVSFTRVSDGGGPPTFTFNRTFSQNNGFNDDNSFTAGSPPDAMQRLITTVTGLYQVNYYVQFSGTTGTGAFQSYLQVNGSGTYGMNQAMKTVTTTDIVQNGSALFNLTSGQYITLVVVGQGTYSCGVGEISAVLISTTI